MLRVAIPAQVPRTLDNRLLDCFHRMERSSRLEVPPLCTLLLLLLSTSLRHLISSSHLRLLVWRERKEGRRGGRSKGGWGRGGREQQDRARG